MKISNNELQDLDGSKVKVAIILPYFNDLLGNDLYQNTEEELRNSGVHEGNIQLVRVPGALEIPIMAKSLALTEEFDVIIALGIIIQGGTAHFEHVCRESINGCMQVQLETMVPIINGILTLESEEQARERVDKTKLNKGKEFAQSAIFMANSLTKQND